MAGREDVSELLVAWSQGDEHALQRLVPLVYDQLRAIAHQHMRREREGHTLETTALVHELYLRLAGSHTVPCHGRAHFLALAARLMRRILVDHARARLAQRRGGGSQVLPLDQILVFSDRQMSELLDLDEALNALARLDERKSRVVEMRHFGGFSVEETAQALDVSPDTVVRDWKLARCWLIRQLRDGAPGLGDRASKAAGGLDP